MSSYQDKIMFNQFKEYLMDRGYMLSTCEDYPKRIEYIIWYEKLSSWQDVVDNIDVLRSEYDYDGIKKDIGQKSHNAVRSALNRFGEFLRYKSSKEKFASVDTNEFLCDDSTIDTDVFPMSLPIYTIKYLDDGYVIKVTADKNKSNNDVFYNEIESTPLMQNLLKKNKGDIVTFYVDNDKVEVEVMDIEFD